MRIKPLSSLTIADLEGNPVWRYLNSDDFDETLVTPLARIPVASLTGKIVGTRVRFNSGELVWALLGNVDANSARLNEHLLTLSLRSEDEWVYLARYHDVDFNENGPKGLALKGDMSPTSFQYRMTYENMRKASLTPCVT